MKLDADIIAKTTTKFLSQIGFPHGEFSLFLQDLQKCGPTALVGGAIRDWALDLRPRDLDFTVDCTPKALKDFFIKRFGLADETEVYEENQFGGFKLCVAGITMDVWPLSQTWAFIQNPEWPKTFEGWLKTPFFNIDTLVYLLDSQVVLEGGFIKAIETKQLDIVNYQNPYPALCLIKTLLHVKKYQMTIAPALEMFFAGCLINQEKRAVYHIPLTRKNIEKAYRYMFKTRLPEELLDSLPAGLQSLREN